MVEETEKKELPSYKGGWIQDFLVALVFLTRLPIILGFSFELNALRSAARCFPLIGIIIGGLSGTVFMMSYAVGLPSLLSAFLAIAAQILLTGALHEDAIGDVADGFGGGANPEQKMEIMRDSRIGTYAVLALIFAIGIKVTALSSLTTPLSAFAVLVSSGAVSRSLMVWAMYLMPSARNDGLGHSAGRPAILVALVATFISVLITIVTLGNLVGAVALLFAIMSAALMGLIAFRQIGGQTGDVLGAIQQIAEIAFIISCIAIIT
jgi:adenosylcobinamide-GDP ribazoletransferase